GHRRGGRIRGTQREPAVHGWRIGVDRERRYKRRYDKGIAYRRRGGKSRLDGDLKRAALISGDSARLADQRTARESQDIRDEVVVGRRKSRCSAEAARCWRSRAPDC